jgi:nicotinamide-nucleotide amidase
VVAIKARGGRVRPRASFEDHALRQLAARVAKRLRSAGESIVTAESCTGGYLAKCLTDRPGSSDYFERGWVTYSNEAKQTELGIGMEALRRHGAVSEAIALAMVRGALDKTVAHHALAVTGVAGPSGGSAAKPAGTVWIGWGYRQKDHVRIHATKFRFRGGRDAVRRQAVAAALKGLLEP